MSRLVSELVMCCSEVDIKNQGTPNSTTPKAAIHTRFLRKSESWPRDAMSGNSMSAAGNVRPNTSTPGLSWRTATRIKR